MIGARPRPRNTFPLLLIVVLTLIPGSLTAQTVTVSLPLDGHYREGRYMPVHVVASGVRATNAVTLKADGAVPTELTCESGTADAIVPWLAARAPLGNVHWESSGASGAVALPLKPLGDDERFVGYFGDPAAARAIADPLFRGKSIIPVALDPSARPLAPVAAFASVDLVVLDDAAARQVTEAQLSVLLAAGCSVAIRADARPGGAWPWQRQGDAWMLRYDPAGPRGAFESAAYLPTYGWSRGWPGSVRRQAALGAVLFAIVVVALSLWRSRRATPVIVVVALLVTGGAIAWGRQQSPVLIAGGPIVVQRAESPSLVQFDDWSYASALRPTTTSLAFLSLERPMFDSMRQFRQSNVTLLCAADGKPIEFRAHLQTNHTFAFLRRSVRAQPLPDQLKNPVMSPLKPLGDQLYPGKIVGELPPPADAGADAWSGVVIRE